MPEDLLLRRTPEEIHGHNRRFAPSLGILKAINLFGPRDWHFAFTFVHDTTTLSIQSAPPLTIADFRRLADGTIPQLFSGRELRFADRSCAVRCTLSPETRSNVVPLATWSAASLLGLQVLAFGGNLLPPAFQSASQVRTQLYERTWFGSHYKATVYGNRSLTWDLFGAVTTYRPQKRIQLLSSSDPLEVFECDILDRDDAHLGAASLVVGNCRDIRPNKLYHSRLGFVSSAIIATDWVPRKHASKVGLPT